MTQKPDKWELFRTGKAHRCQEQVYTGERIDFGGHQCQMVAVGQFNGRWLCKRHTPESKAKKDAEFRARIDKEMADDKLKWDIKAEQMRLTAGLSLEELQALKPERVRASTELYEHLKTMCDAAEIMSCWDKMPNDAYYKAKRFLAHIEAEEKKQ